jgi:phosphatidylserine decarboxylase
MPPRSLIDRVFQQEDINFLLTNRIPRRLLTRIVAWFSRIEHPLVRDLSIGIWKVFADDLRLHEAKKAAFASLHDCFVRELKEGARAIDPDPRVLVSPCDAIVGACGVITGDELLQAKGSAYAVSDLLGGECPINRYRSGQYVTLRLTSSMYHRFHAPADCHIEHVTYIPGEMWNVNPIALKRIPRLFCQNERAIIHTTVDRSEEMVTLVPVGAILVASIHLNFVDVQQDVRYRGPTRLRCQARCGKGDELGYFQHGSTIIVLASAGLERCANVREGERIQMGEPLLRLREYDGRR